MGQRHKFVQISKFEDIKFSIRKFWIKKFFDIKDFNSTNCYDAIQNKQFTAILDMDLTKAFDIVFHETLVKELNHYGI